MNIELSPWFLGGAAFFGVTSILYLIDAWKAEQPTSRLSQRALEFSLFYWTGLLLCWLYHTGGAGASRLWFGLSALCIGVAYRVAVQRYPIYTLGGVITALISLLAVFAYQLVPASATATAGSELPTLLSIHIALALLGLTAFAISAVMSGLYLIVARRLKSKKLATGGARLPSLSVLDQLHLRGLLIGFPLYTAALLIGSAFAFQHAGGLRLSYLIALGSWLIYGGVLQARLTAGWRGKRAARLTLIAFAGLLLVAARYSFR
jgi:ABC-type uncharacterized transport system permease subunit